MCHCVSRRGLETRPLAATDELLTACSTLRRREEYEERLQCRRNLVSILQAEEDRRYVEAKKAALSREAEIMKDVPGWKVGENVYNGDRWMPPATQRHI